MLVRECSCDNTEQSVFQQANVQLWIHIGINRSIKLNQYVVSLSLCLSVSLVFHYQVKMHFFSEKKLSFTEQPLMISLFGTHGERENIPFQM